MTDPAFLLDSNILIYILEGRFAELHRRIEQREPGELVASSISYAEVMRGIRTDDDVTNGSAQLLFGRVPVLPFDEAAASCYGRVPFRRGSFDRLIGAHALARDLTVVTANTADFDDIPGLRVENWTQP